MTSLGEDSRFELVRVIFVYSPAIYDVTHRRKISFSISLVITIHQIEV